MNGARRVIYLETDGIQRRYVLYLPECLSRRPASAPLVVMLDGRGGTPWTAMKTTHWNAKADAEGFALAYPEATRVDPAGPLHFLTNPQMWNAGPGGSDTERPHVDDVAFLRAVINDAVNQANIDASRLYMTGFSNGAAMTYRFALHHPEVLAAIAPVAGHCRVRDEVLSRPIPMIGFFGRIDPLSPYDGGRVDLPWGISEVRPPAIQSAHAWAALCGHHPDDGQEKREPGVSRLTYGLPGSRDEVHFVTIDDLGHVWPGGHRLLPEALVGASSDRVNACDEAWTFFARHRA